MDFIPDLLKAGVTCLKIEGRMKNPEYVATVTRIYRKYIDLAESGSKYIVDENDRKTLLQVFNRGMSSSGHLLTEPNKNLVFKEKPNNMGLFLGKVQKYNKNKGYITVKLQEPIDIGDTISLEKETGTYNVSELMFKNQNIKETSIGQTVTIGRMKGNINLGDKIFKISSKKINTIARDSFKDENRKISLNCKITIKKGFPITINITSANDLDIYKNLNIICKSSMIPEEAIKQPLDSDRVFSQLNKTSDSIFSFKDISIDLDDNVFLPKISTLNELRRDALKQAYDYAINNIKRSPKNVNYDNLNITNKNSSNKQKQISVLLNILNTDFDYSTLENVHNIYIPLKYFTISKYKNILEILNKKFNTYIYMPTILRTNYSNLFYNNIEKIIQSYNIKGFVVSNISNLLLLEDIIKTNNFDIIANYTFNVFNIYSVKELKNLNINRFTISPESDKQILLDLCNNNFILDKEVIVYGNVPLMNINYCLTGKTNKCYPTCTSMCNSANKYYLKDRMNMNFRILFDNIQTVSTIYNSKITSISPSDLNINHLRIDILDENISEINNIISTVLNNGRLEGKEYTNGNLNRTI